ncbi:hypothetical protein CWE14_08775 [Aliidiomarina soli]|uniref:Fluoride-specific ion channel FluC n=1 Tax=Aliidiomarina soli TaxID=1928574 RepID=A0A432WHP2_9GAMM|nr:hypothetical protein CWE14_08775 [Aliidiomarina soli]
MSKVTAAVTEIHQYLTFWHVLWIGLGGGFGAALRFSLSQVVRHKGSHWPWPTWLVNVSGALVLGAIAAYFNDFGYEPAFFFWELGILGGYTTMSTFAVETVALAHQRRIGLALGYAISSVFATLAALMLGFTLAGLLS